MGAIGSCRSPKPASTALNTLDPFGVVGDEIEHQSMEFAHSLRTAGPAIIESGYGHLGSGWSHPKSRPALLSRSIGDLARGDVVRPRDPGTFSTEELDKIDRRIQPLIGVGLHEHSLCPHTALQVFARLSRDT